MHVPRIGWVVIVASIVVVVVAVVAFSWGGAIGSLGGHESVSGTGTLVISGRETEVADLKVSCVWNTYHPEGYVEFASTLPLIDDYSLTVSVFVGPGPPVVRVSYPFGDDQSHVFVSVPADENAIDVVDNGRSGTASFGVPAQSVTWRDAERVVPPIAGKLTWACEKGLNASLPP